MEIGLPQRHWPNGRRHKWEYDTPNRIRPNRLRRNEQFNKSNLRDHNDSDTEKNGNNLYNQFNVLIANARSLALKIDSLIESFEMMNLNAALITESWLLNGKTLKNDLFHLEHGTGLIMICKNRTNRTRVVDRAIAGPRRGGGVAIVYHKNRMQLKECKIPGNKYEMVCGVGSVTGNKRKVVLISTYVPPKTKLATFDAMCECIINFVNKVKTDFSDPLIYLGGNFNKRSLSTILDCFPDVNVLDSPPTRGDNFLDLVATNAGLSHMKTSIHPPLYSPEGNTSDHKCLLTE